MEASSPIFQSVLDSANEGKLFHGTQIKDTKFAFGSRPATFHPVISYSDKQQKTQSCREHRKDSLSTILLLSALSYF